ncbi:hypothetical protein LR48_Vigan05g066400 [Vigna angularis]|uniref:Uncharacterized protein n=1 Tax=Phaseolus angularis TaxID=3914 RepID=A0A0L9UJL0_PHAAN|nr:hypothetical protein LR48_Vigan05g066400 [Vigna angularis]
MAEIGRLGIYLASVGESQQNYASASSSIASNGKDRQPAFGLEEALSLSVRPNSFELIVLGLMMFWGLSVEPKRLISTFVQPVPDLSELTLASFVLCVVGYVSWAMIIHLDGSRCCRGDSFGSQSWKILRLRCSLLRNFPFEHL